MDTDKVPIVNLNEIKETSASKISEIEQYFINHFNVAPDFYIRCPGRVNIIGEHIDYSGFSVLPMAIEKDIIMAVGINKDNKMNFINLDSSNYQALTFSGGSFDICKTKRQWYDYILCGFKGIAEVFDLPKKCLNIAIKGTIPPSSGLSSSSALVCAGALAASFANEIVLNKAEIADLCASAERYIGTQGGGMDQAIIFLGEKGYAKRIDFNPLKSTNVQLPEDLHFIVAHSGVTVNKADSSRYNKRVAECLFAAKILAKFNNLDWRDINRLCDVPQNLNKTEAEMLDCVKSILSDKPYTRKDICQSLEMNESELKEMLKRFEASNPTDFEVFELAKRATHVYTEASNVKNFISSCKKEDFTEIGALLTKSHLSLAENYDCSHEKLDNLVKYALTNGAIGARLTGAGWGGCIIAAVRTDEKNQLLNAMKEYAKKQGLSEDQVFLTKPSVGSAIYK